ncbi:MAG: 16S rRNA (adenine(1518)-N(6)/adenine(1519)-N(6))-dimethyltransferase RsmA [Candidatus Doudnabacteria bacterium]|nr:16S rRNA (adenine(1518)-N(6)/adenine(1519)-N(6))-dimethyltransferase RsmA [Candidatus Doudnabacteria bacterium]
MKITDPNQLKNYLRARSLKPKDYLGQNFLIDEQVLDEIVATADLKPTDVVLEVGPGLGVLTGELASRVKEVFAIEKDPKLVAMLKHEFAGDKKVKIINEDILRFHIARNILSEYKVVANIPYYLTSKLLQTFLESEHPPKSMVLMIQKEVGERVIAEVGELSILGISVQVYADVEISANVSKDSFWPVPKVDSVVIKVTPKDKYPEIKDKKLFFRIIKVAFAGKRKQIQNSLAHGLHLNKQEINEILHKSGIEQTARPQDVSIPQWISLYKVILLDKNPKV